MAAAPGVRALWPLLFVSDIRRSIEFYTTYLGFEMVGSARGEDDSIFWCRLERDGACFMLQQQTDEGSAPQGEGVAFFFVCDDVDRVYRELVDSGVPVSEPEDAYYGMRQLPVPDPDGYDVVFESPTDSWAG